MVDCASAERRLRAHLDRRLAEGERREVEQHLAACPACGARFELEARLGRLRERRPDASDGRAPGRETPGRALLRHFTLISLALTLLAAAATTIAMGRLVESYLLGQVALEARGRLDRIVPPLLRPGELPEQIEPERVARLDTAVRLGVLFPVVQRVALWDRRGNLLYESAPADARTAPAMLAAAADGLQHDVLGPTGRRQLRVLAPIVRGGTVLGTYEVEQDFEPLAAHIHEMQLFAGVSLVGFSLVLYLLLFRLVRGAARDLAAEAAANARLTEAQRRQAERLAVAAELARLLTASLDLEAVVGATLREVRRVVPFSRATVALLDEQGEGSVWALGADGVLGRETLPFDPAASRLDWAIRSREPVLEADVRDRPELPGHRLLAETHGLRAVLTLPLVSKERVLGTLNVGHEEAGAYAESDLEVLRPVAESLAAAVENSRLYAQVQRSSAVAAALLQTAEALARLVPLDQLLEDVAARAVGLLGADDALIFLMDEERRTLVLRASSGVPAEKLAAFPLHRVEPDAVPAFARVCRGGGPLAIEDAPGSALLPPGLAAWYGTRSCVFLPLEVGDRREGVMVVHFNHNTRRFTPEELRLATGLAGQAAVAIANSRAVETVGEVEVLREANRVRSELVSVVTHELRSPLGVVLGFAELLTVDESVGPGARPMANAILNEAARLNKMVDDLLDLGRLESGRFALAREPVDLVAFAGEVAARSAPGAPRHVITVDVAGAPGPVVALADRDRLRQVVDNLVANAVRYSPDGGPVRLRVGRAGADRAFLAVEDEGLGIAPDDLRRLFERFYRSGRPEVRKIKGTGLGLAIAQAIAAAHGGALRAESPGLGRGSTFTVELPAAESVRAPANAPALAGRTA